MVWRAYGPVFVGIQATAALAVAAYFLLPPVREAAEAMLRWKQAGGIWFSGIACIITGGVIPELLKWKFRPAHLPVPTPLELVHQFGIFAIGGMMVDGFYRLQAVWFGDSAAWPVLLVKIGVDQFIYSPFLANPLVVVWFLWRECGYNPVATVRACSWALLRDRTLQIWSTGVVFWPPLLIALYSLPASLQFIAFLFANCAWGIVLVFIARRQVGKEA